MAVSPVAVPRTTRSAAQKLDPVYLATTEPVVKGPHAQTMSALMRHRRVLSFWLTRGIMANGGPAAVDISHFFRDFRGFLSNYVAIAGFRTWWQRQNSARPRLRCWQRSRGDRRNACSVKTEITSADAVRSITNKLGTIAHRQTRLRVFNLRDLHPPIPQDPHHTDLNNTGIQA